MEAVKDSIQQRLDKIKYNYLLFFHPEKIEIPLNISKEEKNKYIKQIYQDKANLHIKLGAKRFQKFVKKFDKAKFKFIKRYIKEERLLRWSDAIDDCKAKRKLKKSKSDQEKQKIIETLKRSKVLVRKQLKEERTISYFSGVDKRIELFPAYLERNKRIHKKCLKRNGIILGASISLGIFGVPIVPWILGGYQVIAGFKNFQCMNAQDYYLAIMNKRKSVIVKKNLTKMHETQNQNKELIKGISEGKAEGKDLYTKDGILDSINTVEGLQQLKARLIAAKQQQEEIIEKMITPSENQNMSNDRIIVKNRGK